MHVENPAAWLSNKKSAAKLNYHINQLLYTKGVELMIFRNPLIDVSISEILSLHDYAEKVVGKPLELESSAIIAEALSEMTFVPSKIDIGKLNHEWSSKKHVYDTVKDFLKDELNGFIVNGDGKSYAPIDVVLYGFGRIGRLCARAIIDMTGMGAQLRLRAIVTRNNDPSSIKKRADLLRLDSVHGPFKGVIETDYENNTMIINGEKVHMIAASDPAKIDYTAYNINNALVIDNTGAWRTKETLGYHLKANGISKALLTAPGKEMPNVVYGVNHKEFLEDDHDLWSAASCTTNAIVPILKVIHDKCGIEKGHIESIHAYTNDQNLLDNMHKKNRRGRSAAINMVITETGAANAVAKTIAELKGKLTASAERVPTPNGSLAVMSLNVKNKTTVEEINEIIRYAALNGPLRNQIFYSIEEELVSTDIIGNACCSVFDSPATKVSADNKSIVLYTWYDNEYGYTQQVMRLAKYVMKVQRNIYD